MTMSTKSAFAAICAAVIIYIVFAIVLGILREHGKTITKVILNKKLRYCIENYQYIKAQYFIENEGEEYFKKLIDLYSQFDNLKNSPCYDKFAFYLYALINVKECRDLAGQELWIVELSGHRAAVAEWRPLALWFMISKQSLWYLSLYLSVVGNSLPMYTISSYLEL